MRMKKVAAVAFGLLLGANMTWAQSHARIEPMDPNLEDVFHILEAMDVSTFRFDLKAFSKDVYHVGVYVDEYEDNQKVGNLISCLLGENVRYMKDIKEENREGFIRDKHLSKRAKKWVDIKDVAIYIRKMDSIANVTFRMSNGHALGMPLKLRVQDDERGRNFYNSRKFELTETEVSGETRIPLVLYGSSWYDENLEVYRFCGENVIDRDKTVGLLKYVPHYFELGLILEKKDR